MQEKNHYAGNNYSRKITVVIFYLLKMNKFDVLKFMQKPVKTFYICNLSKRITLEIIIQEK